MQKLFLIPIRTLVPCFFTISIFFYQNAANEWSRGAIPTPSAAAICPGGRAARGSRAAFHAFLGSVSVLAPSLPPASAAALQAVRCWALHYSQHDRAFLHRLVNFCFANTHSEGLPPQYINVRVLCTRLSEMRC